MKGLVRLFHRNIKHMQQWLFDDDLVLKSVYFLLFNDVYLFFKVFINAHEYAN